MPRSTHFDHGYVVGLLVSDRLDSPDDADRLPDVVGATGIKPKFTRQQGQHRQPLREPEHGAHGMLVNPQPITAAVMADGHITGDVDASGRPLPDAQPGVWLIAGVHKVDLGGHFASFTVEVTTDHTETNPLDLYAASPYVPPTGTTVQTVLLPASGLPGQVLSRTEDGSLAWVEQAGGGVTDHAELTNRGEPDQHPISSVTGLEGALDGKQPAGNYADTDHNHDGVYVKPADLPDVSDVVREGDPRLSDARPPTQHDHDGRYYTESEVDAALDGKADRPSHESILASGNVTLPTEHPVLTIRADDPATLAAPEAPDGTVVTIHVAHGWENLTWGPGITVTGDSTTTETWVVLVRTEGEWKALVSGESGGGSGILTGNGNPNTLGIKAATVGVLYADEAGTDGAALWSANFVDHWDGTTTWVVVNGYADKWTAAGGVELAFTRYGSRLVAYVMVDLTGGGNGEEVTLPASTIDVGEVDEGFMGNPLAGTLVLTTLPEGMGLPSPVQLPPIVCIFTQHGRYVLHMPEVVIPAYTSPDPVAVMGSLELVAEEAPWPVGSGGGGGIGI